MQYWVFALVPLNATMNASTSFSGILASIAQAVVLVRPWAAYVALLGLLALVVRQRGTWTLAVGWIVVFTLPFAAAIAFWPEVWPEHWLSRRYLYAPAVGFCALAALWLVSLPSRWRTAIAAALLLWGLAWTGLTLWGATREAASPSQIETRATWAREMRALEAPSP
jgi:peptidoglycan/LPS O-acetylase OafA/YrhL